MSRREQRSQRIKKLLWIPPVLVFFLLLWGQYWVWESARSLSYELIRTQSCGAAEQILIRLSLLLREREKDIVHLASIWGRGDLESPQERFASDARGIVSREPNYRTISFLNPDGSLRVTVPKDSIPLAFDTHLRSQIQEYIRRKRTDTSDWVMYSAYPLELLHVLSPAYKKMDGRRELVGVVVGSLYLERAVEKVVSAAIPQRFWVGISMDGSSLYTSSKPETDSSSVDTHKSCVSKSVSALGRSWTVDVRPPTRKGLLNHLLRDSAMRFAVNGGIALLASAFLFYALFANYLAKQNREELEKSEARYRRLAENARDMIFRMSVPDGVYEYVSSASNELLGYSPDEFYKTPHLFEQIIDPQWHDYYVKQLSLLLKGEAPPEYEYKITHRSGESRWMNQRNVLVHDRNGATVAIEAIVTNVTERKRIAEERERLIYELETRNADLERFTYTVSHELKAPLITIRGFLGYLEQEAAMGDLARLHEDLLRIQSATETMRRQLSDLVELTRISNARGRLEKIDTVELCDHVVELIEDRIQERGIRVQLDRNMPKINGYRSEISELYRILIENAVKFMGGQEDPHIEIGYENTRTESFFYVQDNGIGIDPRYQERVFGLFNKLDPETDGTGMGLALARRIVILHHGWIRVESKGSGNGTKILFSLPLAE